MPMPGSQQSSMVGFAYFINQYIWGIRIIGIILLIPFFRNGYSKTKIWGKIGYILPIILYCLVFYATNFMMLAEKIFLVVNNKQMVTVAQNKVGEDRLIIGVEYKGQTRAYPIGIIGYHHQVTDTINGEPIFVTYCTVCRTGRVYSPVINGKQENFRLVGMDRFNAMFEDQTTKSWWQQATGIAVAGPLKGTQMKEIFSMQMRLSEWIKLHPSTLILQPDVDFQQQYDRLKNYDAGKGGPLTRKDSSLWQHKSWVIGIILPTRTMAVDWNQLQKSKFIADKDFSLVLLSDGSGFYAFNNHVEDQLLSFTYDPATGMMTDTQTQSKWNLEGECIEGSMKGKFLQKLPAYQEFWHSWQTFHPDTKKFGE
ncbi:MAG: DUF3179 domain-containing protein [Ignavibacteriae bacterium]|nr:DUF3179 domain-containing protein [Ignavibacteriota bacterium]